MTEPRILILIDMSNLYYTTRNKLNRRIDYDRFLEKAINGRTPREKVKAIIHGIDLGEKQQSFETYLKYAGYETKFKMPKVDRNNPNSKPKQTDCDVDIVLDIFDHTLKDDYDILILGSADGDFARCLEIVRDHGKRCEVIGCQLSWKLREVSSDWREISNDMLQAPEDQDNDAEEDIRTQTVES